MRAALLPLFLLTLLAPAAGAAQATAERPNLVVLFADDLGYGDLGSYGNPTIQTPRLDRMAAEGIRLTSFYAGAPVCTPSRAALMTGRHAVRSGLTQVLMPGSPRGMPASEITLAEALGARGYRTAAVGKWHLGDRPEHLPTAHGFHSYLGVPYSNDMMRPWVDVDTQVPLLRDTTVVERPIEQGMMTERFTREALRVIRDNRERPFFLYVAYTMPHLPIDASPPFRGKSRGGLYGDVVEEMDASVGRILDELRAQGLDERTLVVFTSDNGPWLGLPPRMLQGGVHRWHSGSAGPLRGWKATTWEGGVRVPAILRWPGRIEPGRVSAEMATVMDLYATLVRAAGGELPRDRPMDGNDLLPWLTGRAAASPTTEFLYLSGPRVQAVRSGRWKLRQPPAAPGAAPAAAELFDLEVDPGERFDVAAEFPEVAQRLTARLRSAAEQLDAGGTR